MRLLRGLHTVLQRSPERAAIGSPGLVIGRYDKCKNLQAFTAGLVFRCLLLGEQLPVARQPPALIVPWDARQQAKHPRTRDGDIP